MHFVQLRIAWLAIWPVCESARDGDSLPRCDDVVQPPSPPPPPHTHTHTHAPPPPTHPPAHHPPTSPHHPPTWRMHAGPLRPQHLRTFGAQPGPSSSSVALARGSAGTQHSRASPAFSRKGRRPRACRQASRQRRAGVVQRDHVVGQGGVKERDGTPRAAAHSISKPR
jgi:hypothetical protein